MNLLKNFPRIFLSCLCAAVFSQAAPNETAVEEIGRAVRSMQSPEEAVALLRTERDPNRRAEIVKMIDSIGRKFSVDFSKGMPLWSQTLLESALNDEHVYVCEWAIRKIGELKAASFEGSLIDLYNKLPQRFSNSPTPMRRLIIETLGHLKGEASAAFLIDLVNNRVLSDIAGEAIKAMGISCDQRFITSLQGHIEYWEAKLADIEYQEKEEKAKNDSGTIKPDFKRSYLKMEIRESVNSAKHVEASIEGGCSNE